MKLNFWLWSHMAFVSQDLANKVIIRILEASCYIDLLCETMAWLNICFLHRNRAQVFNHLDILILVFLLNCKIIFKIFVKNISVIKCIII